MKRILLLLALPIILFTSCKKEVTEVRQVDQAFSAVYDISPSSWTSSNGGRIYSAELDVPELDSYIYQNGAVLVYLSFNGTSYYEALPQVFDGFAYGVIHGEGYINIDISDILGEVISRPEQAMKAKVVLIDAAQLALKKDVNLKDLSAVEKAFNIK